MVEDLFTAQVTEKKVVVEDTGPKKGKKTYFLDQKAQNLFIVTSRLPPAEIMLRAVDQLNIHSVSIDNLDALFRSWPFEEFDNLMAEYAQDKKAEWAAAESYFIALGQKPKFDLRLRVWLFKINFEQNVSELIGQQTTVCTALQKIKENKNLLKLLGAILKFGNCLNAGNKNKGQADGFALSNLGSTETIRDAEGNSILKICCEKLFEEDNSFGKFKEQFSEVYSAIKMSISELQKKTDKLKTENNMTKSQFNVIEKSDECLMETKFGKQIKKFLESTDEKVEEAEEQMVKVNKAFEEINDAYMVEKKDDMRSKSEKFFAFFANFIDQVDKAMPVIEEPKQKKVIIPPGKKDKKEQQKDIVNEMKKIQAKMQNTQLEDIKEKKKGAPIQESKSLLSSKTKNDKTDSANKPNKMKEQFNDLAHADPIPRGEDVAIVPMERKEKDLDQQIIPLDDNPYYKPIS